MRPALRWMVLIVLAAGVVGSIGWWTGQQRALTLAESRSGKRGPSRRAGEDAAALEGSGTVEGTLVRVASKQPGKIAHVRVREGDTITAGQEVIDIETREADAQLAQARAQLATASARYAEAQAGTRPEAIHQAEAELRRAVAAREGAAAAVSNLERQLTRSTELKQNLDAAKSQSASAHATLQAATARLDRLRAGARPDALQEAKEAVTAAEATAQRAAEEEERMHTAYDRGAVAKRDWDMARTQRDVAAADLARARAHVADVQAGARPEELREAEQQVAAARAEEEGARAALANARQLYEDRLPTRQRLDAARSDLRSADSTVAGARAHLNLLREGTRAEVVRQLRSQVEEARAALRLAESHRSDLTIRSPVDGVVTQRSTEPGEVVVAGVRLLEIADLRRVWVHVYVPERVYGQVRVGARAAVTTDSLPGREFAGRVLSIGQEAEYTPRNVETKEERANRMYAIKVEIENRDGALRIGMPVDVRFL